MNLIHQTLLVLTLLLPATITGHPTEPPVKELQGHRQNWNFDLFHNKHCVGTTVSYAGHGPSGCRSNLETSGAEAFIKVNIDPSCKVTLFKDKKCARRAKVEEIKIETVNKCKAVSRTKAVHSFEVSCR